MTRNSRIVWLSALFAAIVLSSAAAQQTQPSAGSPAPPAESSTPSSAFSAGMQLNIGAETIDNINWQLLGLQPNFAFGKFGLGLDLTLHYRFTGTGTNMEVRQQDWVPTSFSDFFSLYLPKIRYVSYGQEGDPLYGRLGAIDSATLGNGFIVGGYTNTLLEPNVKQFGLDFGLDGSLFKFPYVGMQTFVANLTQFDVIGANLYVRPLLFTGIPIVKNIQISGVIAADRNPYLYYTGTTPAPTGPSVTIFGADLLVPILSNPVISLAGMSSIAREPNGTGGMVGFGGQLIHFIDYQAQIRFLGNNFIPDYFGPTYDLYRVDNYQIASGAVQSTGGIGWFALTGFSALNNKLVFNVSLEGPFKAPPAGSTNYLDYPHLQAIFALQQGALPGFFFSATYDKKLIASFSDLISAENAVIGAAINYQSGPAVITLSYNLQYDPTASPNPWDVTSSLSTSISLF